MKYKAYNEIKSVETNVIKNNNLIFDLCRWDEMLKEELHFLIKKKKNPRSDKNTLNERRDFYCLKLLLIFYEALKNKWGNNKRNEFPPCTNNRNVSNVWKKKIEY